MIFFYLTVKIIKNIENYNRNILNMIFVNKIIIKIWFENHNIMNVNINGIDLEMSV